jgi:hypothetical protein
MCYIKTTILNNIKLVDSKKVKSSIKFAMEDCKIQFNELIICTHYYSPSQTKTQTFKTKLKEFLNTIHKPKLSFNFTL